MLGKPLRTLVLAALVVFMADPAAAAPATGSPTTSTCPDSTCDPIVVGDPGNASYLGSGGLLVDASFSGDPSDRRRLAECPDCRWWLVPVCRRDPSNADAGCRVVAGCPPGWVRMSVWFAGPGRESRVVGRYCLGPAGPMTPGRVGNALSDRFVRRLPALRPGVQPVVTLTGLATCFRSGQVRVTGPWTYYVVGFRISLRAATSWTWSFGDGTFLTTANAGGTYPNLGVTHVFRRPGQVVVRLRSNWTGTYTVDGLGPFVISPQVVQSGAFSLTVREARAVLIDPA